MRYVDDQVEAQLRGARWRKSLHSNTGNCVELAALPLGAIALRNSRHPDGPPLICNRADVAAFLQGAKDGEFDELL
jgi:hypothetical protein